MDQFVLRYHGTVDRAFDPAEGAVLVKRYYKVDVLGCGTQSQGDVTGETNWSIEAEAGGNWLDNVYTSENAGTWTVTGSYGTLTDTATLTVEPGDAAYIEITPSDSSIQAGESQAYNATVYDEFGNEIGDVTDETTWSIDAEAGGSWTDNVYTSEFAGTWTVTGTYGTLTDTATLTVVEEQVTMDIELYAGGDADGWNFVSFYLELENTDLEYILEHEDYGISGNYDRVMYYDATTDEWLTYVPGRDDKYNNLASWDHTMGIWIRMTVDDVLTVAGTEPTSTTITLQPGWNMVGLPSSTAGNHNIPTEVSRIGYFDASEEYNVAYDYDPENFVFQPGEGYWLYNDADYAVDWIVDY